VSVFGSAAEDLIRVGKLEKGGGISLNDSEAHADADVTFRGRPDGYVDAGDGPDRISANGGRGFKAPYDRGPIFVGGPGRDHLVGGPLSDSVHGGLDHVT
jgi:hypothetical protein